MPMNLSIPVAGRKTPLEAIAHLLPDTDLLRDPIPTRWRVGLNADPAVLLKQLDEEIDTPWPPLELLELKPEFPHGYPPEMPTFHNDPKRLRSAFHSGENRRLEWLGDAVVGAVLFSCIYRSHERASAPLNTDFVGKLVGPQLLGHLGLLYGMQLHDFMTSKTNRSTVPAMERVCDSFEAVVGANVLSFGFEHTRDYWLGPLLQPWVNLFTGTSTDSVFVSSTARSLHQKIIAGFDQVPVGPCRSLNLDTSSFILPRNANGSPRLSAADLLAELGADGAAWDEVDASRVIFPPAYPPAAPCLADTSPSALAAAMTDITYRIEFGCTPNTGYRALGLHLCRAAVTELIVKRFESANPAEMVTIQSECLDERLLGRLGFLFNLHRHLRVLRSAQDDSYYITARQSTDAFQALVGVLYLTIGWAPLSTWLGQLFTPWMEATNDGRLRAFPGAQVLREAEERQSQGRGPKRQGQRAREGGET
ncbi:hypothetical protein B0H16DRAFT_1590127 [Mycena metata]|uniref:RNase III domain-containing protein n=1 Tax=Mycena metata TaxID=1033252 RepID=A0AAD7HT70_9AGAR|nr:hypothetical protein B0H16DRAFT_1590127 [Mycena metata]